MEESNLSNNNSEQLVSKQNSANNGFTSKNVQESKENLENSEINEIMENFYNSIKKEDKNIITNTRNLDWLSFLFTNPDLKSMYLHQAHIRQILIYESLYYLNVFSTIFNERIKEKPISKKSMTTLPGIKETKILQTSSCKQNASVLTNTYDYSTGNFPAQTQIKIGLIGCGNIGSELLKKLVEIKDNKIFSYKIFVSTRRPNKIDIDILNRLDEDVSVFLDNEKIMRECDIIFLCIQPHQLDLLSKEIYGVLQDKIERISKKKYKIYPMIISFLSATPIERLKMFFPPNVMLVRTCLNTKILKTKKIDLSSSNFDDNIQGNYIKESCEHLIGKLNLNFIENLLFNLTQMFYTVALKDKVNNEKRIIQKITEIPQFIMAVIVGDADSEKYLQCYNIETQKFIFENEQDKTNLIKSVNNIYIKYINELLKIQ